MKCKFLQLIIVLIIAVNSLHAQKSKIFTLSSPDGNIQLKIEAGDKLQWSVMHQSTTVIAPSPVSLQLQSGETLGDNAKISSSKTEKINNKIAALHYKKDTIVDNYSQLTLKCKGDYGIIFRAYNDGAAYHFFTIKKDTVAFTPVLVELNDSKKAVITEADLEDYPGMFLTNGKNANSLRGDFASYVLEDKQGGHNSLQAFVTKRADYIARTQGTRSFPWRIVIISSSDKELLNNDMVYRLASPSRVEDTSWIKPGKVAWDWWNDWNISHVDFRAGINTETYKYYIDFAAANHIEYILLDEGWADSKDIMKIVPEINLQEIIDYGKQKEVGNWLWGGWLPLDQKIDEALPKYSKMGIKGFKIDFMDRDDQKMVQFYYRMAKKAAEYHLMIDYHGAYKPTGLQRTYPNIVNIEAVHGMEQEKWANRDMPKFDVTIPFIRMIAGPMDYTPGAMRNANKENFRPINSQPMSQGTRCHQLAMYVMYEAPFEMLSNNPTIYMKEPESLNFIASVPTTFDETVALNGKVGEYAAIARRKNDTWFIGAMSNWDAHDITIDLSFLKDGNYEAEIFKDGINADRDATDYKREGIKVSAKDKINVHLSTGGGWVAKIYPAK